MSDLILMDCAELRHDPDISHPRDIVFEMFMMCTLEGLLPIHTAHVPYEFIKPRSYMAVQDARRNRKLRPFIDEYKGNWHRGKSRCIYVYEEEGYFIAPDDYTLLAAYMEIEPSTIPCIVLGYVKSPYAIDVKKSEIDPRLILFGTTEPGKIQCLVVNYV